jgi:hypothetical protein
MELKKYKVYPFAPTLLYVKEKKEIAMGAGACCLALSEGGKGGRN